MPGKVVSCDYLVKASPSGSGGRSTGSASGGGREENYVKRVIALESGVEW